MSGEWVATPVSELRAGYEVLRTSGAQAIIAIQRAGREFISVIYSDGVEVLHGALIVQARRPSRKIAVMMDEDDVWTWGQDNNYDGNPDTLGYRTILACREALQDQDNRR